MNAPNLLPLISCQASARRLSLAPLLPLTLGLGLVGCGSDDHSLKAVRERGELRVAVRAVPVGISRSPVHLQRRLARGFGNVLGVDTTFVETASPAAAHAAVRAGQADMAATGAPVPVPGRRDGLTFGRHIQYVDEVVLYRLNGTQPKDPRDLGAPVGVPSGSDIGQRAGAAQFAVAQGTDAPALIERVSRKELAYAGVAADYFAAFSSFFPEVREAFRAAVRVPTAWVFPSGARALRTASVYYVATLVRDGELARALEEQHVDLGEFDYVATRRLIRRIRRRLGLWSK